MIVLMDEYKNQLCELGWTTFRQVLSASAIDDLRQALNESYVICRDYQISKNLPLTAGTCHHIIFFHPAFMSVLDQIAAMPEIADFFCGKFILNSFGGVINSRENRSYVGKVHRDLRSFSDRLPLMATGLLMLDDFTL